MSEGWSDLLLAEVFAMNRTGLPRHLAEEIGMPRGGAELVLWCADPEPAVETEDVSWAWEHPRKGVLP